VEPFSSGLGGGIYLLHRASDGFEVAVDGRERAPFAATRDMYLAADGSVDAARSRDGALAAAIPGTPAALVHIARRYGRLPLARSLAPAVRLAREGFAVDARFAVLTERYAPKLERQGPSPFVVEGRAPREGERLVQADLARTLVELGRDGGASFYRGRTAARLVGAVRAAGGIWTREDLAAYRPLERAPLAGSYRGQRVTTAAPPSSGGVPLLETLNQLAAFDLEQADAPTRVHLIVEAWRRAFRDRNELLADPDFVPVPVARLIDPRYALALAATIDPARATPSADLPPAPDPGARTDTSHFSVVDADGNRVAGSQTVNLRYGAGLVPAGTGVVLNDEMDDFTAKPGVPNAFRLVQGAANAIEPGKRPLSSMTPTFVDGPRGFAVLGTPGGSRIISMVTLAVLDYMAGGDAASMVRVPRFHHQYLPDAIEHEPGALSPELRAALAGKGHQLREVSRRYGNMNVVTWGSGAPPLAATDPRNETLVDF
jgi:gamma-glutamyltranspeptidase/glutathione hydrolase